MRKRNVNDKREKKEVKKQKVQRTTEKELK